MVERKKKRRTVFGKVFPMHLPRKGQTVPKNIPCPRKRNTIK